MLLEAVTVAKDIDWTTIITAVVGLVGGGAVLKLYEARQKKIKEDREHEEEPEMFIRNLLADQVDELVQDMKAMRNRMEELLVSNAQLEAENKSLIKANQDLIAKNIELIEINQQLLIRLNSSTSL